MVGEYYQLTKDIDLTGEVWNAGAPFEDEDGTYLYPYFRGILDGNGHTIKGLHVETDKDYAGLFGLLYGTVKNLTLENPVIKKISTHSLIIT